MSKRRKLNEIAAVFNSNGGFSNISTAAPTTSSAFEPFAPAYYDQTQYAFEPYGLADDFSLDEVFEDVRELSEIESEIRDIFDEESKDIDENSKLPTDACKRENYMARKQLRILCDYSSDLLEMLDSGCDLPEWAKAQLTVSSTYVRDVKHYLEHGEHGDCLSEGTARKRSAKRHGRRRG